MNSNLFSNTMENQNNQPMLPTSQTALQNTIGSILSTVSIPLQNLPGLKPQTQPASVPSLDEQRKARLAGPSSKKVKFTKAEDAKLAMLVAEYSDNDWKTIADHMVPRTARQCRERWTNYVNPSLSKDPWTPEEDLLLIEKHKEFGNHWKIIEKYFNNRSKNNIKHRWASMKESFSNNEGSTISNTLAHTASPTAEPAQTSDSSSSISPIISAPPSNSNNNRIKQNPLGVFPSNIVAAAVAAARAPLPKVTLPQINKLPQPVVVVSQQPIPIIPEPIIDTASTFQNQAPGPYSIQMPFLESGAGGAGRSGIINDSTGIDRSEFVGDVEIDVDTIREEEPTTLSTFDSFHFQFFDRILDQHEVYVQSLDKADFWTLPEESYF